jgi:hypothetical protein
MAKKKTSSPPDPPQVVAPTFGDTSGNIIKDTPATGRAAGEAGGESMMAGVQSLASFLLTNGALALSKPLEKGLKDTTAAVNKVTGKLSPLLESLETKMTTWNSTVTRLTEKQAAGTATPKELRELATAQKNITKNQPKVDEYKQTIADQNKRITDYMENEVANAPTLTGLIDDKFPEFKNALAAAQPYLSKMGTLGPAGEQLMSALNAGYQANNITPQQVQTSLAALPEEVRATSISGVKMGDFGAANAVRAGNVANISTGTVGQGMLGGQLMNRAMEGIQRGGMLSQQATRDAIQSARQGFAARGLATGNAALGAELLNRDRYARVREFEDLGFASNVQSQDLSRQFQNVGNQLTADRSNQQTQLGISLANQQAAMQAELANLQARYNQAVQEGDWAMAAQKANQATDLEAQIANQNTASSINQFNAGQINTTASNNAILDFNAQQFNETNRLAANQYDISLKGDAYNLQQGVLGEGLKAVDANFQLASKANPNNLMMQLYGSQPNFGAEALSSTTNTANNAANNSVIAQGFNSNMFAGLQIADMNNKASLQSSNILAGANRYAANMDLLGSGIQAAGSVAGGVAGGGK